MGRQRAKPAPVTVAPIFVDRYTGAALFRISETTFDQWTKADGFPHPVEIPMFNDPRWLLDEIQRWAHSLPRRKPKPEVVK